MTVIDGIDVSSLQWPADKDKLRTAGLRFAYVKASQYSSIVDWTFPKWVSLFRELGIPCGPYHFCAVGGKEPGKVQNPIAQANFFYQASEGLGSKPGECPPMIDYEFVTPGISKEAASDWLDAFADEVERLWFPENRLLMAQGRDVRRPVLYLYPWFSKSQQPNLGRTRATRLPLCMAYYPNGFGPGIPPEDSVPPTTDGWDFATMWQYSGNKGTKVPGIAADCDRDRFMGSESAFKRFLGLQEDRPADSVEGQVIDDVFDALNSAKQVLA